MKKLKSLVVALVMGMILFTSCEKSQEDLIKEKVEQFVIENAHDAESYEFIKLGKTDTNFLYEKNERNLEFYSIFIDGGSNLDEVREYGAKYDSVHQIQLGIINGTINDDRRC